MTCRFLRASLMALLLVSLSFSTHQVQVQAQTQPKLQVPAETPGHAQTIIDYLLENDRIIHPGEVKRGMKGYALSVFQGTQIEKFPIMVLGTLERVQGGGDIVLIKVLGGPVVERNSGIVAGMSGSPVYIDGKMLGAIAMGWGFPKEPIGGVTPITEMIETSLPDPTRAHARAQSELPTLRSALDDAVFKSAASKNVYKPNEPLVIADHQIAKVEVTRDPQRLALSGPKSGATMALRPVNTLLQVSGFSEKSLTRLKQAFEPYQISPIIGPSSRKSVPSPPITPGAAMGVQLVSGDMDQTAIGTVTFRWGNKILGFGHPMFGQGASSLPLTSAYVHEIFPSYQRSFKLASPIQAIGAVQQDTQFAVGGTLHTKADTIPMVVSVSEPARAINRTYRVQIMKDPILTPQLIMTVAGEAIQTKLGKTSDKTVKIQLRMDFENAPSVQRSNILYAGDTVTKAALVDLTQTLMLSQQNEFSRGSVRRVELDVQVEEGRSTAVIKAMTVNKNKVKAGESLQVNVVLEPTAAPDKPVTKTFRFDIPADAPSGTLRLAAAASVNYWPLQIRVGGAPPDPTDLRELISAWNQVGSFNELMVQASTAQSYLQIGDQKITDPPATWSRLMRAARTTTVGAFNEVEIRRAQTSFVLNGAQLLSIPIESINNDEQTSLEESESSTLSATSAPSEENSPPIFSTLGEDDKTDAAHFTGFIAPPANGVWGALDDETPWEEVYSLPPLFSEQVKSTFKEHRLIIPEVLSAPKVLSGTELQQQPDKKPTPPIIPGAGQTASPAAPAAGSTATEKKTAPAVTPVQSATPAPKAPQPFGSGKSVGRPSLAWVQAGAAEFLKGKFEGALVASNGEVRVAPRVRKIAQTNDPFIWSIAGDSNGNSYLGTGLSSSNRARILRVDSDGKQSVFWEGSGAAVTALTIDKTGNLYAGITPGGRLLRITPEGETQLLHQSAQTFIWALEWSGENLLLGTGGGQGEVIQIPDAATASAPAGKTIGTTLLTLPQKHVRALAVRGTELFLGTGSEGVLYRYEQESKRLEALWQAGTAATAANSEVLALAAMPDALYFGSSLNGTVYRWSTENGVETVYPSPQKTIYALAGTPDGHIYAATGESGIVYQIRPAKKPSETRVARALEPDQRQALALAAVGDALLIGTGNSAAVYRLETHNEGSGYYLSPVFDSKNSVRWGMLRFVGHGVRIETRTGNTAKPDSSWSSWQAPIANSFDELSIASPAARYLQYRAILQNPESTSSERTSEESTSAASLSRVEIVYRTANTAPEVALTLPQGGEFWMGKKKVTWTGKDADKDTLQYQVDISQDQGKTWEPLHDKPLKALSYDWDTTQYPDGSYRLRITADDALSNAEEAKSSEVFSLPFIIDNTAPTLLARLEKTETGWHLSAEATDVLSPISGAEWRFVAKEKTENSENSDGSEAEASATSKKSEEKEDEASGGSTKITTTTLITIKKPREETWRAINATDGIFDSRYETMKALIPAHLLPQTASSDDDEAADDGQEEDAEEANTEETDTESTSEKDSESTLEAVEYQLELRVYDAAGNSATVKLDLP